MKPVVVAGAGISGLAVAFELRRLGVPVLVLESAERAGGKIESDRRDGYLCERGPASYLDRSGSITALTRALGMEERVLWANQAAERRLVAANGRLHDTPRTAGEFAGSALLPWWAKLRASLDLILPPARPAPSSTSTGTPRRRSSKATASPEMPAPATTTGFIVMCE